LTIFAANCSEMISLQLYHRH